MLEIREKSVIMLRKFRNAFTDPSSLVSLVGTRYGELVLYEIFQPCLVIYGGQFPQLEEQIVHGSEPATFR